MAEISNLHKIVSNRSPYSETDRRDTDQLRSEFIVYIHRSDIVFLLYTTSLRSYTCRIMEMADMIQSAAKGCHFGLYGKCVVNCLLFPLFNYSFFNFFAVEFLAIRLYDVWLVGVVLVSNQVRVLNGARRR